MKIKKIGALLLFTLLTAQALIAEPMPVRIKDIGKIIEARDNQLLGYGLVVGLKNTGDSKSSAITQIAMRNLLSKLGIASGEKDSNIRNVASVIVTATLPPFIKKGQKIPVTVSSLADSTSLAGGTLIITPLRGPDLQIYAVAQGPVLIGGISEKTDNYRVYKNQTTVGTIPEGGIVETEVPVTFIDQQNITIVLNDSNFITVSRATQAIQDNGFSGAKAIDANTIKIPLSDLSSSDLISTIAKLENISVIPDGSAKIIIDSKSGTVVIGEMVRLFPVAITHGAISIKISETATVGGPAFGAGAGNAPAPEPIQIEEIENKIVYLNPSATLSSLVNALNEIGASPQDLISIIQSLQKSGSLIAEIEII